MQSAGHGSVAKISLKSGAVTASTRPRQQRQKPAQDVIRRGGFRGTDRRTHLDGRPGGTHDNSFAKRVQRGQIEGPDGTAPYADSREADHGEGSVAGCTRGGANQRVGNEADRSTGIVDEAREEKRAARS